MFKDSLSVRTPGPIVKVLVILVGTITLFFFSNFFSAIVILFVLGLFVSGSSQQLLDSVEGNNFINLLYIVVVAAVVLWFLYRFLIWWGKKPKKFLLLSNKPTLHQLADILKMYAAYFLVIILVSGLLSAFSIVDVNQTQELGISDPEGVVQLVIIFVSLVVVPPIFEEVLFRGFLYNSLIRFVSFVPSVILTSVLFGIAHLEYDRLNWIAAIDTLIFSVFLIRISQKHASIYSAMIMHALKNCIAFFSLFVF